MLWSSHLNQCCLVDQALYISVWRRTYCKCAFLRDKSLPPFHFNFTFSLLRHYSCLDWNVSPLPAWLFCFCSESSPAVSLKKKNAWGSSTAIFNKLVDRRLLGQAIWAHPVNNCVDICNVKRIMDFDCQGSLLH